ncbi:glycine zipper domain-containing protein [Nitrospina watsonii]|uniref:Glycine zipper family protein n=1 Tax=Nitrospina watsonii TaxID=1323948 RepID=A0ABN8VXH8_9BACT|nr:glycine zipper domain-containing protein [Nitrospina watsonii]CAI2718499.1 conserved exported protein of unknown function [Nitrospina watsonii]
MTKVFVPFLILSFIFSGCASYGNYQPVIDPKADASPQTLQVDLKECRELAAQAAETVQEAGKGSVVGGAIGAFFGGLFGFITGNPVRGASTGAVIGGGVGGVKGGLSAEEKYKRVYRNCMRNRGHTVLD